MIQFNKIFIQLKKQGIAHHYLVLVQVFPDEGQPEEARNQQEDGEVRRQEDRADFENLCLEMETCLSIKNSFDSQMSFIAVEITAETCKLKIDF